MRVAIITPSSDMVHASYAACLAKLITSSSANGVEICYINPRSSLVQKGRTDGVQTALSIDADKILFIDSDQTFPKYGLLQLLSHNKKIVGATCRQRVEPHEFTARNMNGDRIDFGKRTGLHEVKSNGFPFCLIDCEVFYKIPKHFWFRVSNGETWAGEDENFCHQAGKIGYKIWVDADLTKEVGHIGTKVY
jgi:hypothetical protein